MTQRLMSAVAVCAGLLAAESGIAPPWMGLALDTQGRVRPVYGLPGNFLAAGPLGNAVAAAYSGRQGLIKTAGQVLVLDSAGRLSTSYAAPDGTALFGFGPAGEAALCYFPSSRELRDLRAGARPVDLGFIEGEPVAVAGGSGSRIRLVVAREARLRLVTLSGNGEILSEEMLPYSGGPAALLPDGALAVAEGKELIVRDAGTGERRIALPAPALRVDLMGDGWLSIAQPDGPPFAWHDGAGYTGGLFRLPLGEAAE